MTPRVRKLFVLLLALLAIQLCLMALAGWMVGQKLDPSTTSDRAVETWMGR